MQSVVSERPGAVRLPGLVLRNPDLRRLTLAWAALVLAGSGYQIGLLVVAFRSGGQRDVAIALAVQILPPALIGPFTSVLGDRVARVPLMVSVDAVRCLCTGAVALAVASGGSLALVLVLGAPGALCSTTYGPAVRGLLPSLAREPQELTAANVVESGIEHAGLLVGPGLAGLILAVAGPEWTFAGSAVMFALSGLAVAGLRRGRERPRSTGVRSGWRVELFAGVSAVARDGRLKLLVGLYAAVAVAGGALQVFTVVIAHRLAGLGDPGVGELTAVVGVGGLLGTVAVAGVATRRRLSVVVALAFGLWGGGLALIGLVPARAVAFPGLVLVGIGNVAGDVGLVTLLQRIVPEEVVSRVFGLLQSVMAMAVVLGALVAPALVLGLGTRGALVLTGCLLPVILVVGWSRLRSADALHEDALARASLLSSTELFAPLPAPTIAGLAANLAPVAVAQGRTVIREGDPGDSFYLIADGVVDVTVGGEHVRTQGPGEAFGELALLRDVPRTATVTARTAVRLYSLDRGPFLAAVTGHPESVAAADVLIATRLGSAGPIGAMP